MAALKWYVNTIHTVMRVNPADVNSWTHIYGSLCCLRESVICYACRKLAINPVRPLPSKCKHNICKRCVGSNLQLKTHCKWCSEFKTYEENVQLRLILQCYKKMCKFIMASGIFCCWRGSKLSSPMLRFASLVYEGAGLKDNYHYMSRFQNGPSKNSLASTVISKYEENYQSVNGQITLYNIKVNDPKSAKVMIKKAAIKECMLSNYTDSDSDTSVFDDPHIIQECLRTVKKRKSCRCGMATRNPGKLTCCGQRCPCYVGTRPCISCCCRDCRNPLKNLISSPKHSFRAINDASSEPNNMDVDFESSEDTSCSDSDKDPSV